MVKEKGSLSSIYTDTDTHTHTQPRPTPKCPYCGGMLKGTCSKYLQECDDCGSVWHLEEICE